MINEFNKAHNIIDALIFENDSLELKVKKLDDAYAKAVWDFEIAAMELNNLKDSMSCEGCKDQNMGSIYGCNSAMIVCNRMKFDDRYKSSTQQSKSRLDELTLKFLEKYKITNRQQFDGDIPEKCQTCSAEQEEEQPQAGTHCYTIKYKCGSSADTAFGGEWYDYYCNCSKINECKDKNG